MEIIVYAADSWDKPLGLMEQITCQRYYMYLTRLGDRSFAVAGPQIWNSLSADLRLVDNYARFRHS